MKLRQANVIIVRVIALIVIPQLYALNVTTRHIYINNHVIPHVNLVLMLVLHLMNAYLVMLIVLFAMPLGVWNVKINITFLIKFAILFALQAYLRLLIAANHAKILVQLVPFFRIIVLLVK